MRNIGFFECSFRNTRKPAITKPAKINAPLCEPNYYSNAHIHSQTLLGLFASDVSVIYNTSAMNKTPKRIAYLVGGTMIILAVTAFITVIPWVFAVVSILLITGWFIIYFRFLD